MDIGLVFTLLIAAFILLFGLVCANAGLGGGPAYIAVLVLAGFPFGAIRPAAFLLTATLSLVTAIRFYRDGGLSWRTLFPLAIGSIPTAFLASGIVLSPLAANWLTGSVLLCSALGWIVRSRRIQRNKGKVVPIWLGLVLGAAIGFLSGLVGIGGGTFLLPVLAFSGWTLGQDLRATVSAVVFLTSVAALSGDHALEIAGYPQMLYFVPAVLAAAWLGTEFKLKNQTGIHLTRLLSLILVLGALRLFLGL